MPPMPATLSHPHVGSLSNPSKMPGYAWGISAAECITGQKLRKVKGSVCSKCYCCRGNYKFPAVTNTHSIRIEKFNDSKDGQWELGMVSLIKKSKTKYFRWFDSGDLQSVDMLRRIVWIANECKGVRFWLPSREWGMVGQFVRNGGKFPSNLNVRLSAYMIDGNPPMKLAASMGCTASNVVTTKGNCYSQTSGTGNCGTCRKCWNKNVPTVSYESH